MKEKVRINNQIRSPKLRVIDDADGNLGLMNTEDALKLAQEKGLDLIEISPNAEPPVAKIMDYGRFQYIAQKSTAYQSHGTSPTSRLAQHERGNQHTGTQQAARRGTVRDDLRHGRRDAPQRADADAR